MKKFKAYGLILLGCLSCFIYGAYVCDSLKHDVHIEPKQWVLTAIFGIMFLITGLNELKKD